MECPNCGGLRDKVIDSRLSIDRLSIRRRRQCLTCSKRFTTYETTEDRILPVLIKKKTGHRVTKANLKMMLAFISQTLSDLSDETKKLVNKADRLARAQTAMTSDGKSAVKKASKRKLGARRRSTAKVQA